MENAKYLKTVVIDKLIENEATEVEDVTIEEARLSLYLNGEKSHIYDDYTKRPRSSCYWFFDE